MTQVREITCIACPMGCRLLVTPGNEGNLTVDGATCKRGIEYGKQEYTCPMRTVTTSIRVKGGERPVCSVKTNKTIPKERIADVFAIINRMQITAPVKIGQVIVADIAGTGADMVATSDC